MVRREFLKGGLGAALATNLGGCAITGDRGAFSTPIPSTDFQKERRFAATRYGRIAYSERGTNDLAALFLHGWPLNGFHWRGSLAALAPYRRCIAPDFMGLGYSEIPASQDLSPVRQADMIAAFMTVIGVAAADVVANDSGTAVAQLLAVRHPACVRSMLLTNGDVHTNSPSEALRPAIEAARRGDLASMIERHLTDPTFAASPQGLGAICYTRPANFTRESMEIYFRPLLADATRRAQFQQFGVVFEPNPLPAIEHSLKRVAAPTRMLWGQADIHFAPEWAFWLDRVLPNSRGVRLVSGAKLFFTEERTDLVAEEAIRLWNPA